MIIYIKGKKIRQIRKILGLNQEDMADLVGVSRQQYCTYETNTSNIREDRFLKMINVLDNAIDKKKKELNLLGKIDGDSLKE